MTDSLYVSKESDAVNNKILIINNHLKDFAGSEILSIEIAEFFISIGWQVDFFTSIFDNPLKQEKIFDTTNVYVLNQKNPNPFEYNIVWSQHQLLPILIDEYIETYNPNTFFIFSHLSPFEPFESRGLYCETLFSDLTIANSEETKNKLLELGVEYNSIINIKNAAPSRFYNQQKIINQDLKSLLLISNHIPEELNDAIEILDTKGVKVIKYGIGNEQSRISPNKLQGIDAIITIGKSVQYSMLAGIPIFNYDHFGGSGWVTKQNYLNLEAYNYSGRDSQTRLSPQEIAEVIVEDYSNVIKDIAFLQEYAKCNYILENILNNIITLSQITKKLSISVDDLYNIKAECIISKLISRGYVGHITCSDTMKLLNLSIHDKNIYIDSLERLNNTLSHENHSLTNQVHSKHYENESLTNQINNVVNSTSWKITKPVRMLGRIIKRICGN